MSRSTNDGFPLLEVGTFVGVAIVAAIMASSLLGTGSPARQGLSAGAGIASWWVAAFAAAAVLAVLGTIFIFWLDSGR